MAALTADPPPASDIGHLDVVQGVPVVRLTGELDLLTRAHLTKMLRPVVSSAALTVVVDTSAVTFIDLAGLSPLLAAASDLRRRQARLVMLRPSTAVLRLATLTGTCGPLDMSSESAPSGR